ncbi:hypothetical protein [Parasitella parasitica]|uniref:Ubiquitin carboxyl-terminal hydrolase n=1 Tax=Parasitella parasitica TaxID=35722 RepID=A0A0B7MWR0_9FUNG|nr:hypothetical protein [Parasitella parasitica]
MNEQAENWALLPSDPAIFDDMIQQYGIQDTKVEEVISIDFVETYNPSSVHGLMLVSRYAEEDLPNDFDKIDPLGEQIVFTAQVVTNVCGTLALLAILLNADIEKGEILNNFLRFTEGFSPVNRGLCLGSCSEIRKIHDAFARNAYHTAEHALNENLDSTENDNFDYIVSEDFHYITYIHKNGYIWELDGLKKQPVRLKACLEEEWLSTVKPIIEARMKSTGQDDLSFNLMAVTKDSYHTMLTHKKIYDACLHTVNEEVRRELAYSTLRAHKKRFFSTIQDESIPHYATMDDIWKSVCNRDFKIAKTKLDIFAEQIAPFSQQVDVMTAEKEVARAGVLRQKWDYFPFIQSLFAYSFHHNILGPNVPIDESAVNSNMEKKRKRDRNSSSANSNLEKKKRRC